MLRTCSDHFTSTRSKEEWNVFFWTRKPLTDVHQYSFLWKKTDVKDSDHHLATEIFVHMTSTLPLWHSLCHLISLLFFSVSPFAPLFTSIPLPSTSSLPWGEGSAAWCSPPFYLLFRLSMLCIHNLAEASHHTHHPSTSPMLPASLCVYKIMCFLSIYAPTLSFNSLLSAAGFVVHILSSLACLSAPSRQYECHVACLYSMSIIIPTTKHSSKGEERATEKLTHSGLSILSWPFYHQDQQSEPPLSVSCSLILKSDSGCSAIS